MRYINIIVFLIIFQQANSQCYQWTKKSNVGDTTFQESVGLSNNGLGYIGTGYQDVTSDEMKGMWEYNPSTDTWIEIQNYGGVARRDATGFSIGKYIYIGTGYDGTSTREDFWKYDTQNNTWTQINNTGYAKTGAVGGATEGKGFVTAGSNDLTIIYDTTSNNWTLGQNYPGNASYGAVSFTIDSFIYVGTGYDGGTNYYKDFWKYNVKNDSWTSINDFGGSTRRSAVAFSINGLGYVGTGFDGSQSLKDFWEYNPATGNWTEIDSFDGSAREKAVGFSIGNKGYVGTGDDGGLYQKDFWEFSVINVKSIFSYEDSSLAYQFSDSSNNATSWYWTFGDGDTSKNQNPQHTYSSNGTYTVCLTVSDTCGTDSSCQTIKACRTINSDFIHTDSGLTVSFNNKSKNGKNWLWEFGDKETDTVKNPVHTYDSSGTYNVCLTAYSSCDTNKFCDNISVTSTGINRIPEGNEINVYPNPFSQRSTIHFQNKLSGKIELKIFDIYGHKLRTLIKENPTKMTINREKLSKGLYFYQLSNENEQVKTGKLIIR